MRHIILISGKDSLAAALIQTTREPNLPYEFLFNDTGCELPETYSWLARIEAKTGWKINRIGKSLEAEIKRKNGFLPGIFSRYCTKNSKVKPMDAWLGQYPAIVYYGLRADEERVGYIPTTKNNILPVYPLRINGLGLAHVLAILKATDLQPPGFFWERLHIAVT